MYKFLQSDTYATYCFQYLPVLQQPVFLQMLVYKNHHMQNILENLQGGPSRKTN